MKKSELRKIIREEIQMMNEGITLQPKNLKTKKYRNGDPIRHAQSKQDWIEAGKNEEGAYCVSPTGGYLYNWYAVNDPRGLCRVPTDKQWKSVTDTESLQVFDGLRDDNGSFIGQGGDAYFWSSSEHNSDYAWNRYVNFVSSDPSRGSTNKRFGYSVRCL